MRILVAGTGGVGSAFAQIAKQRSFFERCALADYDVAARPELLVAELDDGRRAGSVIPRTVSMSSVVVRRLSSDAI